VPRPSLVDAAERAVRSWLEPGRFRPGDRLPPEQELARMLEISRGTLRSALRRLERTGEIVRRQGSGTYVGRIDSRSGGGHRSLRVGTYRPRIVSGELGVAAVRVERAPIGASVGDALQVEGTRPGTRVQRVLTTGEARGVVAHDFFHPDLPLPAEPQLEAVLSAGHTIHEFLESEDTSLGVARTRISPRMITPAEPLGRELELEVDTACLELEELVLDPGGHPLLYSWDVIAPGALAIEVVEWNVGPPPAPLVIRADP
jgi:GntR family transcriptional regulator